MKERETLNRLVVATLEGRTLKARQLFNKIMDENPKVFMTDRVRGFRGFVQIINHFENVSQVNIGLGRPKGYTLKK